MIDDAASIEKSGDNDRCIEVIVEGIEASLTQVGDGDIALLGRFEVVEALPSVHHSLVSLFGSLKSFVREVDSAAVVSLKDEETNGHRFVGLSELFVRAVEELLESDEVAE